MNLVYIVTYMETDRIIVHMKEMALEERVRGDVQVNDD